MTCDVFFDSSVVVAAALGTPVGALVEGLSTRCRVYYSSLYLAVDVMGSKNIDEHLKPIILGFARDHLRDAGSLTPSQESRVFGRYGRWVKRIGKIDAAIAYLAVARGYILATGDMGQFRFYESIYSSRNPNSPLKAMFIPVRWFA